MNWEFVRREWGAVTFVLTVLLGLIVVPVALYLGNQSAPAAPLPTPSEASSARTTSPASAPRIVTPSP